MGEALRLAAEATDGAPPTPSPKAKVPAGGRLMIAMLTASNNNCPCTVCRLMRAEAKQVGDAAIAELEEDGGSPDNIEG
jgi:hypothetical protein